MKKYIKPTVEVVELSVKEPIAGLSTKKTYDGNFSLKGQSAGLTTVTLASLAGQTSTQTLG